MYIKHHEDGDSEYTFKVTMIVGPDDDRESSVCIGGLRYIIYRYDSPITKSQFFVIEEMYTRVKINGSPDFDSKSEAVQWLIDFLEG